MIRKAQEYSIPLLAGVVGAVLWANVSPGSYEAVMHASPWAGSHLNLHFLVNDIFMALFFGIAAGEIVEAVLPGGPLNPPRKAINPLLGTLGGVVGPIGVYFAWTFLTGDASIANGWGIPTATDIALAWLVARLAFGASHPAVSFLLLLAVADDALGLGIIAIFYPDPMHPVQPMFLLLVGAAMGVAWFMRARGVRNYWLYLLVPGGISWAGLFLAHLHPALALVPVVALMPHASHDEGVFAEDSSSKHTDVLNRFQHAFRLPVDFGLFFFGLANAGVGLSSVGNATWAVLLALVVGKAVGIYAFCMVGVRFGFALPSGMNRRSLFVAGLTAALGLTVALFVANVAFTDAVLQGAAKMGALFSAGVAPVVLVIAKLLKAHEIDESAERPSEQTPPANGSPARAA